MTPTLEEVKKVAIECGISARFVYSDENGELRAFAQHFMNKQREIDLKLCREQSDKYWKFRGTKDWTSYAEGMSDGADECEEAIRKNTGE